MGIHTLTHQHIIQMLRREAAKTSIPITAKQNQTCLLRRGEWLVARQRISRGDACRGRYYINIIIKAIQNQTYLLRRGEWLVARQRKSREYSTHRGGIIQPPLGASHDNAIAGEIRGVQHTQGGDHTATLGSITWQCYCWGDKSSGVYIQTKFTTHKWFHLSHAITPNNFFHTSIFAHFLHILSYIFSHIFHIRIHTLSHIFYILLKLDNISLHLKAKRVLNSPVLHHARQRVRVLGTRFRSR